MENLKEIDKYKESFNTEIKDNILLISEELTDGCWYKIVDKKKDKEVIIGILKDEYKSFKELYIFEGDIYKRYEPIAWFGDSFCNFTKLTPEELFDYFKKIAIAKNYVQGYEFRNKNSKHWIKCSGNYKLIADFDSDTFLGIADSYVIYQNGEWCEVRKIEKSELLEFDYSEVEILKNENEKLQNENQRIIEKLQNENFVKEIVVIAKNKLINKKDRLKNIIKYVKTW